jgi:hypothetical protein
VSKFVQNNAKEQEQDDNHTARSRGGTPTAVVPESEPRDEKHKRDMDTQLNASDA